MSNKPVIGKIEQLSNEPIPMKINVQEMGVAGVSIMEEIAKKKDKRIERLLGLLKLVEYIPHETEGVNEQNCYCPFCFSEAVEDADMKHKAECPLKAELEASE